MRLFMDLYCIVELMTTMHSADRPVLHPWTVYRKCTFSWLFRYCTVSSLFRHYAFSQWDCTYHNQECLNIPLLMCQYISPSGIYEYCVLDLLVCTMFVNCVWISCPQLTGLHCGYRQFVNITHSVDGSVLWLLAVYEYHTLLISMCCGYQQCMNLIHPVDGSMLCLSAVYEYHILC